VTQLEHKKPILKRVRRVVVKIGSQILSSHDGIEEARLRGLVRQLAELHEGKRQVVVVSSGAVAAGMTQLGWKERPKTIPEKQALAAVGQIKLMALYERIFSKFDKNVAQVLLTAADLANRQRYINAKHTFQMLLESSIIPIVNENDTVAVEEMKFGDNDHLSALVATLLEADLLVILSDVEGVYDKDPRAHDDAELIPLIGAARFAPGNRRRKRQCSGHRRYRHQTWRRRRGCCGGHPDNHRQRYATRRAEESLRRQTTDWHIDSSRREISAAQEALDRF
jgi:glutamate 5-kinase